MKEVMESLRLPIRGRELYENVAPISHLVKKAGYNILENNFIVDTQSLLSSIEVDPHYTTFAFEI